MFNPSDSELVDVVEDDKVEVDGEDEEGEEGEEGDEDDKDEEEEVCFLTMPAEFLKVRLILPVLMFLSGGKL